MHYKLKDIIQFPDRLQDKGSHWQYLVPEFGIYLQNYLTVFEQHRKEIGLIPTEKDWKQLPFGPFANTSDWKWRRQSLAIFQNLTKHRAFNCSLEIGPWNGWLTKFLAEKSKTVIAADYFVCPFDGIGNIQTLVDNIVAIQCNVDTIKTDFKPQSFDLIVLNHNLAYMNNPVDYIQQLIPLLKPGGMIISLGNAFLKTPEKKISANDFLAKQFYNRYGMDLYIQPVKGYLDFEDIQQLENSGFEIEVYKDKYWQNLYSKLNPAAPFYTYITYKNV
ncbi:class I SAM-dependent methyltransferase [Flavobacterium terrisoli]|uniref:class I SAM-dependent methyltransferase n=1 Tax=Flavobacterium terrisoli TaxID=3242195 RepID=UPI002542A385|nr:methyltransferase domain-containing protein [Flavobacterium buctense]